MCDLGHHDHHEHFGFLVDVPEIRALIDETTRLRAAMSDDAARVNALGRRSPIKGDETVLRISDLEMDLIGRVVRRAGEVIDLQPREFRLLEVLMRNKGKVITRTMLLERVWDFHFDPKTSVVETHISRLRAKIDKPFQTELIQTIRGAGYSIGEHI